MALWVTPDNLDISKISISKGTSSEGYDRFKIIYQYNPNSEPRDLVVTVPKIPNAYVRCRGVQKDVFVQGDKRITTNRYGAQFVLIGDNPEHTKLYQAFATIKSRIEELTESAATFPVKDMETYSILYTNLIHSNDGKMYSTAYTATEQIDITECNSCIVRPAFLISMLKRSATEVKIRLQISQMYVHEFIKEFPLAHVD
jgi:hypothetical protein